MLKLDHGASGFSLSGAAGLLFAHRPGAPCLFVGRGQPEIACYRGNFKIEDYVSERQALTHCTLREAEGRIVADFAPGAHAAPLLSLRFEIAADQARIAFTAHDETLNRIWLRLPARAGEKLWGGGEQMSYFDMKGRRFPLFTSEPGVGRDKTSQITFQADVTGQAGGDYYNTNYPQPTFLSSRRYAAHLQTTAYCAFDFRHAEFHELEAWAIPESVEFFESPSYIGLVRQMAQRFGQPPALPDWVHDGAILGLKEGEKSFTRMNAIAEAGAKIVGLWCEDWCGVRETSFGTRLFWDWRANDKRYPGLREKIAALRERGVRFLGYINPYLAVDGVLYPEAKARNYLVRNAEGAVYVMDFGEFDCGILDFTNPQAADWFADKVIGNEMLDLGLGGWMADFGEYLPTDAVLASGLPGLEAHNLWPVLWAQVNEKALALRGKTEEVLFFMRAGFTGIQAHNRLLWAGDQCVDFSRHDGLQTVICGALSSGLLGNPYHHSDIGGYTSLFGNVRNADLLMRWSEMAAFTAVMRSHEGNRPRENLQIDEDARVLAHFARMTRIFAALAPYRRAVAAEAGLPMQRPLFLHFEDDPACYESQTSYLLGEDLLVAPVISAQSFTMDVYLPKGADWVHLWSGSRHVGGQTVSVATPYGEPPVYYRAGSAHEPLFGTCAKL